MTTEILDLPEVRELLPQLIPRVSVEEYRRLGEHGFLDKRTELIRGIILNKVSRSPLHASIASKLFKKILFALPPGVNARQEQPLTFIDSEPEPDVSVMRGNDDDFVRAHPPTAELVVEVAVTSVALDRANASLYAENNVKEYWIVIAHEKVVEVYRELEAGVYRERRVYGSGEILACTSVPGVSIVLAELFA